MERPLTATGDRAGSLPAPGLVASWTTIFEGCRAGWSPGPLIIAWVACLVVGGAHSLLGAAVAVGVGVVVIGNAALLLAASAGWRYGRAERWVASRSLPLLRSRTYGLFGALLFALLGAVFLLAIPLGGAWLLGRIPAAGSALSIAWLIVLGVPFGAIGIVWILLAALALPLFAPAAALEFPDPFDVASRSISYVRQRPFKYLGYLLTVTAAVVAAGAVVCAVVTSLACLLLLSYHLGSGLLEEGWSWRDLYALGRSAAKLVWFGWTPIAGADTAAVAVPTALRWVLVALGRLVEAGGLAAAVAALSRAYLLLRWELDREPPTALVRPDETFNWS